MMVGELQIVKAGPRFNTRHRALLLWYRECCMLCVLAIELFPNCIRNKQFFLQKNVLTKALCVPSDCNSAEYVLNIKFGFRDRALLTSVVSASKDCQTFFPDLNLEISYLQTRTVTYLRSVTRVRSNTTSPMYCI